MTTALLRALPTLDTRVTPTLPITMADIEADRRALEYIESHLAEWERAIARREYEHALHCRCHACQTRAERLFQDNGGFLR